MIPPWLLVVILGAFIIVYAYMRPKTDLNKQSGVVDDIETTLDQFAMELEEDNKELLNTISGLKRELEAEINKLNGRVFALERQDSNNHLVVERVIKPLEPVSLPIPDNDADTETDSILAINTVENDIKNRYANIFDLHEQGKSIEYIAKKISMNKGEVQLIIQLARQEEQFRA